MTYLIPTKDKKLSHPNDGTGLLYASYNMDYSTRKGKLGTSGNVLKALNTTDESTLAGYVAAFWNYGDQTYGVGDRVFYANNITNDPTSDWAKYADTPSPGNTVTDGVVFDGKMLAVDGDDIYASTGSTFSSWWKGTLGQSGLTTGNRILLWVGSDGNLYVIDGGNQVHRVDTSGTVSLASSDTGTLDFSATQHVMTCRATNSTRSFIGTEHPTEGVIIEWDMAPNSVTPNRIHKIGAKAVRCIGVWNDTPIAVLSNGNIKYFDGVVFKDWDGVRFPSAAVDVFLDDTFIHPNGFAVIDDLPHFLISGKVETGEENYVETQQSLWHMPAGVWCLDPDIGLYHRFAIGAGASTQFDYGQTAMLAVGALYATNHKNTKFLASCEYFTDDTTSTSVIVYHDEANTKPSRSFMVTAPFLSLSGSWEDLMLLHRKLFAGDQMTVYKRKFEEDSTILGGTWGTTTQFNTTDDASDVSVGDVMLIKMGRGAGAIHKITDKNDSAATTVLTIETANPLISAGDDCTVEVLNFRFLGTFTDMADWHSFAFPDIEHSHQMQVLIEIQKSAGAREEISYVIINDE